VYRIDGAKVGKDEWMLPGISKLLFISTPGTYIIKGFNKETNEQVFANKVVIE
jgi:hypothetical protein